MNVVKLPDGEVLAQCRADYSPITHHASFLENKEIGYRGQKHTLVCKCNSGTKKFPDKRLLASHSTNQMIQNKPNSKLP